MSDEDTKTDDAHDDGREPDPSVDPGSAIDPKHVGGLDAPADATSAGSPHGSPRLYFVAFALILVSFAALVLGGLALIGKGTSGSPAGFFWASIVLSVIALALAIASLFVPRRG